MLVWQRQAKLGDGVYEFRKTIPKACGLEAATRQIRYNEVLIGWRKSKRSVAGVTLVGR